MDTDSMNTAVCCAKVLISNDLANRLDKIYPLALSAARRMLKRRAESSSKFYPEIPCVISKSLITKYQRNAKCQQIRNLTIPVCGDKGKQVKIETSGLRVPAIFGKSIIPFMFVREIIGFVRLVEFFRRDGQWMMAVCYNTPCLEKIEVDGVIGVDRNSVGNVAVFADPKNGVVRKLGICPSRTKVAMRGRRKNLQKAKKFRLLAKLRRKQRRRMTHENHSASKSIVDYAVKHRRAVAIEKLTGIYSEGSKIRRYSEKNQWAFAQLGTFIRYKCALRGVPVIEVNPAFTSQDCSRCGNRHKTDGKKFSCKNCGHNEHRDANASFNIALRGCVSIGVCSGSLSVLPLRPIGGPQAEKGGAL